MLGWFPTPYPDELFFSICARYSDVMHYSSEISVLQDIFGVSHHPSVHFLGNLEKFISRLPVKDCFSPDELIRNHTLLPYYAPFLPLERLEYVLDKMLRGGTEYISNSLGIRKAQIKHPRYLRFCPLCYQSEMELGEPYWHRLPQIPGVEVCPTHHVFLHNSSVETGHISRGHFFSSARKAIDANIDSIQKLDLENYSHKTLLSIAEYSQWLLGQPLHKFDCADLYSVYDDLLLEKGLLRHNGCLNYARFLEFLTERIPLSLFQSYNLETKEKKNVGWIKDILNNLKYGFSYHPLKHLLFIFTLDLDIESFIAKCYSNKWKAKLPHLHPFGAGPFPCLNRTCKNYRQHVIKQLSVKAYKTKQGVQIGIFTCGECGYTYQRRGNDQKGEKKFTYSRVLDFGAVWLAKLKDLWINSEVSTRQIRIILGHGSECIIKRAVELNLPFPRTKRPSSATSLSNSLVSFAHRVQVDLNVKKQNKREEWLKIIKAHPYASRTDLQKTYPAYYNYFRRNDKEWFIQTLPAPKSMRAPIKAIDYEQRDLDFLQAITKAEKDLRNSTIRPVRITKNKIFKQAELPNIWTLRIKTTLPLSYQKIKEATESYENFVKRRIQWTINFLERTQLKLTFDNIRRHSGLAATTYKKTWVKEFVKQTITKQYDSSELCD
jgi:hypothetical protein